MNDIHAAQDRWYHLRSRNKSLLGYGLQLLIVMLWIPSIMSPGESSFNITIVLAMFLVILVVVTPNFLRPPFSTGADRTLLAIFGAVIAILAALALASATYASEPFRVFRVIAGLAFGIAILYAIVNLRPDWRTFFSLMNVHIWCAVASSLFVTACYFYAPLTALAFGEGDRTAGFFKQSNQFGIALALTAPIAIGAMIAERFSPYRMAQSFGLLLGLIFSGSKTNLIIAFVMVAVVAFLWVIRTRAIRQFPPLALALVVALGLVGAAGFYLVGELNPRAQRLITQVASGESVQSIDDRLQIYDASVEEGWRSPFTGMGAGQTFGVRETTHSHNVFVDYFRTMGFPGLFLISVLILTMLVHAMRGISLRGPWRTASTEERALMAGCALSIVSYVISNQLSDSFGPSTLPLCWLSVGLLFMARGSALRTAKERIAPARPVVQRGGGRTVMA